MLLWPAFGIQGEFVATAAVVALEWLGQRSSLLYLTITNELTIVDTVMMTLTEKLDFSAVSLIYANFLLSRRVATIANTTNNPNIATATGDNFVHNVTCTTFQNSIRSSDNYLIVLCQEELKCVSILGIQQRITALENDGEWLEALALGLDHYESTVESQEDRKRDQDFN